MFIYMHKVWMGAYSMACLWGSEDNFEKQLSPAFTESREITGLHHILTSWALLPATDIFSSTYYPSFLKYIVIVWLYVCMCVKYVCRGVTCSDFLWAKTSMLLGSLLWRRVFQGRWSIPFCMKTQEKQLKSLGSLQNWPYSLVPLPLQECSRNFSWMETRKDAWKRQRPTVLPGEETLLLVELSASYAVCSRFPMFVIYHIIWCDGFDDTALFENFCSYKWPLTHIPVNYPIQHTAPPSWPWVPPLLRSATDTLSRVSKELC